ncbi:MAG: TIR domain-containing protein [Rhodobacteraceae bacterium]|nr:TIR domain-containing protein [Paracoccaceae bacterium]
MADVFISYKREDIDVASALAAMLRAAGYSVWWDSALLAGEEFSGVIDRELKAARAVVVIWSPRSIQSKWVRAEALYAFNHETLVSLRTEDVDLSQLLAIYQQMHVVPVSDHAAVLMSVGRLAGRAREADAPVAPAPPSEPRALPDLSYTAPQLGDEPHIPKLVVDPWSGRGDHTSIQAAIEAAADFARIFIRPGTYEEALAIAKPVELIGLGAREEVVVVAEASEAMVTTAPMVRAIGLKLERGGGGASAGCGVRSAAGRLELIGCDLTSQSAFVVQAEGRASLRLTACRVVKGAVGGVCVRDEAKVVLEDCDIIGGAMAGVAVVKGANPSLRRCRLRDGGNSGLLVQSGGRGLLEECEISGNRYHGVTVQEGGRPVLRRSAIVNNGRSGVRIKDADSGAVVEECDLRGNGRGAWEIAEGAEQKLIRRDTQD